MLTLNCLSLDEPGKGHFSVLIDRYDSVSGLKIAIYEKLESFYINRRVDIHDLGLFLPSDLPVEPIPSLVERAKKARQSSTPLTEFDRLSSHLPCEPDGKRLHVLIDTKEIIEKRRKWILDELVEKPLVETIRAARRAASPSEAALPNRICSQQTKYPIYNGRSDSHRGPPITIYNTAFARLKDALEDMSNIEVTSQELKAAHLLLTMSVKFFYYEGHRMEQTDVQLEKLLGCSIVNTAPGHGHIRAYVNERRVILAHLRWKNELGSEGDAGYHASCDYRKYVVGSECEEIRKRTCCPAIIVGIMGPYLCLMGGVFVGEIIVQPFTDYVFLGGDPNYGKRVLHIARMFKATQRALLELERYYETSLPGDSNFEALLPQPSVIDESNPCPGLRFSGKLFPDNSASALYSAKLNDRDVIVKFTGSYCGDAQRLLASHNLAPALHFCGRIHGGLWMIVMDYVRGCESDDMPNSLSPEIRADVRLAVDLLHDKGYVFGDLRAQNILIVEKTKEGLNGGLRVVNGASDHDTKSGYSLTTTNGHGVTSRLGAILVDFDWCGKDSESRYPTTLNDTGEIDWAPGVERFGVMKKEHDEYLLRKLGIPGAHETNGHR